jgi:hypothetical protein
MAKFKPQQILEHPDKEEIIAKLSLDISSKDIADWLRDKYSSVGENKFVISEKNINNFKENYFDFYNQVRDDVLKLRELESPDQELSNLVKNNPKYHDALNKYIDQEIDIKQTIKKMVSNIETRTSQLFDEIQADPRNIKMDRTLIEWFNVLLNTCEKYDAILNGSPAQQNITNNINIQVFDKHMSVVHNVIRQILSRLDYETSLLFIDLYNEEIKKIDGNQIIPVEERLEEVKILTEKTLEVLT